MFHVFRDLSHKQVLTGVVYGLLRDVDRLTRMHAAAGVAFCFDRGGKQARRKLFPGYKIKRDMWNPSMKVARDEMHTQLKLLQEDYLPSAGFTNVFAADGYEADDVIASVVRNMAGDERAVVVSSDKDLYQLIDGRHVVWDGKRVVTEAVLKAEFGVGPKDWKYVKAIAGCTSDCIPGVKGVGETLAARHVAGENIGVGRMAKIKEFMAEGLYDRNLQLVTLPLDGCPAFTLTYEKQDLKKYDALVKRLGIKSLKGIDPYGGYKPDTKILKRHEG